MSWRHHVHSQEFAAIALRTQKEQNDLFLQGTRSEMHTKMAIAGANELKEEKHQPQTRGKQSFLSKEIFRNGAFDPQRGCFLHLKLFK